MQRERGRAWDRANRHLGLPGPTCCSEQGQSDQGAQSFVQGWFKYLHKQRAQTSVSPGPGADHSHREILVLTSSFPEPAGSCPVSVRPKRPTLQPSATPYFWPFLSPGSHQPGCREPAGAHAKGHGKVGASRAPSKPPALDQLAGEQLGSRRAGLNADVSAWNAKSRRPKGKEKGFGGQGNESARGGRGQAEPGQMLQGSKRKPLTGMLRCRGVHCPRASAWVSWGVQLAPAKVQQL